MRPQKKDGGMIFRKKIIENGIVVQTIIDIREEIQTPSEENFNFFENFSLSVTYSSYMMYV